MGDLWKAEEIALLHTNREIPGRTFEACKRKRRMEGIPQVPLPAKPKVAKPKPAKVVIPRQDPEWWARARRYMADGMTLPEIASAMGRSLTAISYATDEAVRQRVRAASLQAHHAKRAAGVKRSRLPLDCKRLVARREARDQWFRDGMPGHVNAYYRRLDCL